MREPVLQDKRQEHAKFCTSCIELVERVTGAPLSPGMESSLAKINKSEVVAQTKISYREKDLLQLIYQHLQAKGLTDTAALLQKEAGLPARPPVWKLCAAPVVSQHRLHPTNCPAIAVRVAGFSLPDAQLFCGEDSVCALPEQERCCDAHPHGLCRKAAAEPRNDADQLAVHAGAAEAQWHVPGVACAQAAVVHLDGLHHAHLAPATLAVAGHDCQGVPPQPARTVQEPCGGLPTLRTVCAPPVSGASVPGAAPVSMAARLQRCQVFPPSRWIGWCQASPKVCLQP
ncbi:hypothetical protein MTO96_045150, partial [Rhipicephalus appendiculatus]